MLSTQNPQFKTPESAMRASAARVVPKLRVQNVETRPDGLYSFVQAFWSTVESEAFVPGRHLEFICSHLEAVSRGEISRLVINVPPGYTKSDLVGVFWPAWEWAEIDPGLRFLCSGHNYELSTRDSVKMRRLVESENYQRVYGYPFDLEGDQNAKTRYENTRRGSRIVVPIGGGTGERVERVILDDPNNAADIFKPNAMTLVQNAYSNTFIHRGSDPKRFAIVVVMQRLDESDLSGFVLEREQNVVHVCLPEKFDPDFKCVTAWGEDWRTMRDELLWPERKTLADVEKENFVMDSYAIAGQKQQRPSPADGGVFPRAHIQYWVPKDRPDLARVPIKVGEEQIYAVTLPVTLEEIRAGNWFDTQIQSWDMAEKDKVTSAFTVGQIWGARDANRYLLDQVRGRWAFSTVLEELIALRDLYPNATAKYIEDKALGIVTIQTLHDTVTGIIGVEPDGGKVSRAWGVEPVFKAKQVFAPHPKLFEWVPSWVNEIVTFPKGKFADMVDTTTQGLKMLLHFAQDDGGFMGSRRSR